jgi:hypothetical protein
MTDIEAQHTGHWPAAGLLLQSRVFSEDDKSDCKASVLNVQRQLVFRPMFTYFSHKSTFKSTFCYNVGRSSFTKA